MRMKPHAVLLAACCLAAPAMAKDAAKLEVVAFNVGVLVEVDATGKPVKVEASQDVPKPIRDFIEKRVASWQYQPARIDGVPQSAITYVAVNACAVPVAEGYRLGLDFDGNGPRKASDQRLLPPQYPSQAMRSGIEAEFVLILGVETDGRTVIDRIERADVSGRAGANEFEPLLRRWVKTLRFDPEHVAGKPVRGQVSMPVSFMLRDLGNRRALADELQTKAKASRECQTAAGASDMKPIALQPVVGVIPTPPG